MPLLPPIRTLPVWRMARKPPLLKAGFGRRVPPRSASSSLPKGICLPRAHIWARYAALLIEPTLRGIGKMAFFVGGAYALYHFSGVKDLVKGTSQVMADIDQACRSIEGTVKQAEKKVAGAVEKFPEIIAGAEKDVFAAVKEVQKYVGPIGKHVEAEALKASTEVGKHLTALWKTVTGGGFDGLKDRNEDNGGNGDVAHVVAAAVDVVSTTEK
ncbi:uncharacterized protein LAESUDRAFT_811499 [Laetiporus sulphureus 93-53]|uniref:Uncharacterized protein n=1 Tax=Laetiporus sulphureus 93-53 TaxID=1314785 RepID=A0A165F551_9APHY|nr:uncharacterized protein LAESUDRAFT_811499 [Laetiporus sulphureus 93-53]KZT08411.1 hypothetical protein LAESUDRAFT_811499 [Laetiporus sulphureus 93-53]